MHLSNQPPRQFNCAAFLHKYEPLPDYDKKDGVESLPASYAILWKIHKDVRYRKDVETERFIGKSENRRPNEMWLRRRRSKRLDAIIQVGNLQMQKDILPAPKNPVPLLEQDRKIMHRAADIKEFPRKPRIVKPEGSPPKIA